MIKLHLFLDIINLIFPKTCYSCKSVLVKNERVLCLKCYVDLPKHFNRQNIHQLILSVNGKNYKLYRRYKFQKKSAIQKLIYELKYNNKAYLGEYLGKELENKHIILLDDVFTTGATISECIKVLEQIRNINITIICMA